MHRNRLTNKEKLWENKVRVALGLQKLELELCTLAELHKVAFGFRKPALGLEIQERIWLERWTGIRRIDHFDLAPEIDRVRDSLLYEHPQKHVVHSNHAHLDQSCQNSLQAERQACEGPPPGKPVPQSLLWELPFCNQPSCHGFHVPLATTDQPCLQIERSRIQSPLIGQIHDPSSP
jgi:hypothetical protein